MSDTAPNLQLATPVSPFHALIPTDLAPVDLPETACGTIGCLDGWLVTDRGMLRCPACEAQAQTERLAAQYEQAGVEGTLFHQEWADMQLEHGSWRLARAFGESIGDVLADAINLVLVGEVGRGKTQAGVLLAKDALQAGHSALVVTWADWVDDVMSDYSRRSRTQAEHIEDLVAPDLLVLDDVGAAATQTGELERKLFTRVIDGRYRRRRATVMTSNLTSRQLQDAMGVRAFDRIQHACEWIIFDGPTYRAEVERSRVADTIARIRGEAGL
ncbi:ATP-binding protein [Deinococcus radiophilus]|uniref:ATP-binding protein n=1 Tax=Deinococcus radiophilus TaxID=32062 RepID=A0A3S0IAI7_9DEIO|nr:ATP-binding protein [Deinococcus radiophilus]RTR29044.1 ATP-binding protein [Deinococcus radiophilus]UFA49630.1 ATP-binding protein [Deinococcus radiophilus]